MQLRAIRLSSRSVNSCSLSHDLHEELQPLPRVAGDGNGPTAQYLNPRPRDYRLGLFKFTTTLSSERLPGKICIAYQVRYPRNQHASFLLLDSPKNNHQDTAAVVEYVRWLAMRGEMEKRLGDEMTTDYSESGLLAAAEKSKADARRIRKSRNPFRNDERSE